MVADPFSAVDDVLAEYGGSASAMLERIVGLARTTAFVSALVLSQLPFPVASIVGDLGADMLEGHVSPDLIAAKKMLGYANLAMLGAMVAKVGYHALKAAAHYVMQHGFVGTIRNAWNGVKSLAQKAWGWMHRKRPIKGACGCFVAGTVVWTVAGLVPIEQIRTGDYVLSRSEDSGMLSFEPVEQEITVLDAALLEVTLRYESATSSTLDTTDEHPFRVKGAGWRRADQLQPGDAVETLDGTATVLSLAFCSRRATVYNLSVAETRTFHVGADGILVHNCPPTEIIWNGRNSAHVLRHGQDIPGRTVSHGVFNNDPLLTTQEAWYRAQRLGLQPRPEGSLWVYEVEMGRIVGIEGGADKSQGALSIVRIIMKETGEVVSAYPIK